MYLNVQFAPSLKKLLMQLKREHSFTSMLANRCACVCVCVEADNVFGGYSNSLFLLSLYLYVCVGKFPGIFF